MTRLSSYFARHRHSFWPSWVRSSLHLRSQNHWVSSSSRYWWRPKYEGWSLWVHPWENPWCGTQFCCRHRALANNHWRARSWTSKFFLLQVPNWRSFLKTLLFTGLLLHDDQYVLEWRSHPGFRRHYFFRSFPYESIWERVRVSRLPPISTSLLWFLCTLFGFRRHISRKKHHYSPLESKFDAANHEIDTLEAVTQELSDGLATYRSQDKLTAD